MKAVILYSQHENGQLEQAQILASQLGAYATVIDPVDVYGTELGLALLNLLGPREFPAIVLVQDHLAGILPTQTLDASIAEQQDIETREFFKSTSDYLEKVLDNAREQVRVIVRPLINVDLLSDEERFTLLQIYSPWTIGEYYKIEDLVTYNGHLYSVIQAHTAQDTWTPDITTALFARKTPEGTISAWVQPLGAHDAYTLDVLVTHNGKTWRSIVADNVWEPGVYGWEEVVT